MLGQIASSDIETLGDSADRGGRAGYRAPPPLLPTLLDAAVRAKALRCTIAGVLGARGRWLAAQRPQWRNLTDTGEEADPAWDQDMPAPWTRPRLRRRSTTGGRRSGRRHAGSWRGGPGRPCSGRAVARAGAALRLEAHAAGARLAVTLPGKPGDAAVRDGIAPMAPGSGIGA